MRVALVVLWVFVGALVLTLGLAVVVRALGALRQRRVARYQQRTREPLAALAAQVGGQPPPPPRGRLQRRLMQRDLLALRPNLKGRAADEIAALFTAYGLVDVAARDLRSRSVVVRRQAAEVLGVMPVGRAVEPLVAGLADRDRLVRLACARGVATLGDVARLPAVLDALAGEAEHPTDAVEILAGFGRPAVPLLRERLSATARPGERRLAARTLGALRAPVAAPDLRAMLDEDDPALLVDAARALGAIGDRGAVGRLGELVGRHADPAVRTAAAAALGAIDDPEARPRLIDALGATDWGVRDAAARALVALGASHIPAATADATGATDGGIAHLAGVLDIAGRLEPIIVRAHAGDGPADRFIRRACRGGASARLAELAGGDGPLAGYSAAVLAAADAVGAGR